MGARPGRAAAWASAQHMNERDATDFEAPRPAMSAEEVARVVALLEAVDAVHPDLENVLTEVDGDRVVDEIFSDEVHAQRA
jgi:hypothetical protein